MKIIFSSFLLLSFCNFLFASKEFKPILGKYINQAELAAKIPVKLTDSSIKNDQDVQEMWEGKLVSFKGILPDRSQVQVYSNLKFGPWAMIINAGQTRKLKRF